MATLPQTSAPSQGASADGQPLVSVVIPCLNEAENIEQCVRESFAAMERAGLKGEVVVSDNNSTDGSGDLAAAAGARVVHEPRPGYGSAYLAGFAAARGDYIVMLDADLTYPFEEIPAFVEKLQSGADLVMGDRMDNIQPGAVDGRPGARDALLEVLRLVEAGDDDRHLRCGDARGGLVDVRGLDGRHLLRRTGTRAGGGSRAYRKPQAG